MNLKELARLCAPLLGIGEDESYARGRRLVEGGVIAPGPPGKGRALDAADKAKFLLSFVAAPDRSGAAADAVRKFWGLQPASWAYHESPLAKVPFGPAVQMLLLAIGNRQLAWHPNLIEVNATAGTGVIIATHADIGVASVLYDGTPTSGPAWPQRIEVVRRLPPAVLVAVAFNGVEHVPAHLQYIIHGQPAPATPATAA